MRINIDGPYYSRRREIKGILRELSAYTVILKIVACTAIILIGIATLNRLDTIMTQQADLTYQVIVLQQDIDALRVDEPEEPEAVSLGDYVITFYCLENYPHICNNGDSSCTASGQAPIPHYTVAADKSIPFGTILVIDGAEYEVMDRGGNINGNRLDLAVETHAEAISRGKITREVYTSGE